jgi:hypothetical protein
LKSTHLQACKPVWPKQHLETSLLPQFELCPKGWCNVTASKVSRVAGSVSGSTAPHHSKHAGPAPRKGSYCHRSAPKLPAEKSGILHTTFVWLLIRVVQLDCCGHFVCQGGSKSVVRKPLTSTRISCALPLGVRGKFRGGGGFFRVAILVTKSNRLWCGPYVVPCCPRSYSAGCVLSLTVLKIDGCPNYLYHGGGMGPVVRGGFPCACQTQEMPTKKTGVCCVSFA